jgi:hypothetical protein
VDRNTGLLQQRFGKRQQYSIVGPQKLVHNIVQ